ncbi:DUF397 domain-containing protein [Streptomyces sp. NPDC000410]|uniref:DUF397 domain-containing protein n=1 Tax=Streptomyces sp. NPDC000410 TaxID=3154254 RepID=UPI00332EECD6
MPSANRATPTELKWFKSSFSGANETECVETAPLPGTMMVRDSKRPHGPRIEVIEPAWDDFVRALREGWIG